MLQSILSSKSDCVNFLCYIARADYSTRAFYTQCIVLVFTIRNAQWTVDVGMPGQIDPATTRLRGRLAVLTGKRPMADCYRERCLTFQLAWE
jgi:hypothetical protein